MDWTMQFQDTTGLFWILNLLFAFGPLSILGPIGIVGFLSNNYKTWKKPLYVIAMWCIGFLIFLACTILNSPVTLPAHSVLRSLRQNFFGILADQLSEKSCSIA